MECTFVYGFLWARLQTGGWETVAQAQTPTLFALPVSSSANTHLLFSFLLSGKMSKISQLSLFFFYSLLLLTQLTHQETKSFATDNSALASITCMDSSLVTLGLLIFSSFCCCFFSSFFKRVTALSPFDRFLWPPGQRFYVMLLPPGKMLTAV